MKETTSHPTLCLENQDDALLLLSVSAKQNRRIPDPQITNENTFEKQKFSTEDKRPL